MRQPASQRRSQRRSQRKSPKMLVKETLPRRRRKVLRKKKNLPRKTSALTPSLKMRKTQKPKH